MDLLIQIGLLVIGFTMLVKGADYFVDGAAGIAGTGGSIGLALRSACHHGGRTQHHPAAIYVLMTKAPDGCFFHTYFARKQA